MRKQPEVKVGLGPRPNVVGMGLKKIRALARDPFAFMWNVRASTRYQLLVQQLLLLLLLVFLILLPHLLLLPHQPLLVLLLLPRLRLQLPQFN